MDFSVKEGLCRIHTERPLHVIHKLPLHTLNSGVLAIEIDPFYTSFQFSKAIVWQLSPLSVEKFVVSKS